MNTLETAATHQKMPDLEVKTGLGSVLGKNAGQGVRVFKGIPYAAPPTGSRRWEPPQAVEGWGGVREARAFAPDCPQTIDVGSRASCQDEDCLYLNIWSPSGARPGRLPVMVWIHGGSYVSGSGSEARLDGTRLAAEGVVVVTFNYRLGIFGFLAHPQLTEASPHQSSSNYALLDQIAAFNWVKQHIAAFGGDPERITAFGVSAGSASISLLLASPLGGGLFDRAILESPGACRRLASLEEAEQAGLSLAPEIDTLRQMSAAEVLALTPKLAPPVRGLTTPRVLRPIRDGWVIPEEESEVFNALRMHKMPLIVGVNADEGTQATASWPVSTVSDYNLLLQTSFGTQAEQAKQVYPVSEDDDVREKVAELFADTQFNHGSRLLSRCMTSAGKPVWNYVFTRRRSYQNDGPHHGQEVHYVFGNLLAPYPGEQPVADDTDKALSQAMVAAWVSFAREAVPLLPSGLNWPAICQNNMPYMEWGDVPQVAMNWRQQQLDFMERYFSQK